MASPYVVAVGSSVNSTGAPTVGLPPGWIEGDLLFIVASTANQSLGTPSTYDLASNLPAGIGSAGAAGGVKLFVFWKRATASESDVALADSGSFTIAQMFAVRGAIASGDPFDVSASTQQTTATTTITYPTVTTSVDDTLILMFAGLDQDAASTANLGAPTNANLEWLLEFMDRTVTAGAGGGYGVLMGGKATAGATGTTTASLTSQVCVTYTAAIKGDSAQAVPNYFYSGSQQGGTGTLTVPVPDPYNENDIFVMFCHTANQNLPTSPPTGWNNVPTPASGLGTAGAAGGIKLHVFWRRATASESDVSLGDSGDYTAARIFSFKECVESGDPWNIDDAFTQASASTALSFPSITTTEDNCLIVMAVAGDFDHASGASGAMLSVNPTNGSGVVGVAEMADHSLATNTGGEYAVLYALKKTAGATGNTTSTLTQSQVFTGWIGALKPVSSGTTYTKACYATATGSVTIARLNTFLIVASAAASGSVSILRLIRKILSVSGAATPSLIRGVSKTLAATASGAVTATQTLVGDIVAQCYATGSGTVSLSKRITKVFAASATGAVSLSKLIPKVFTAAGTGALSLSKRITKVLTASGTGAATYADAATFKRAFAITGTGTASVRKLIRKTLSVTSSATASVIKLARKTLTVTAAATASAAQGFVLKRASTSTGQGAASSSQTFIAKPTTLDYARLLIRNVTRNLVRLIRRT